MLGSVLRVHEVSQDLQKFDKMSILDVAETTNLAFCFLEYEEEGLLFQGGIGGVTAIDYANKKVVAKFTLQGNVFDMKISSDGANLLVGCKIMGE